MNGYKQKISSAIRTDDLELAFIYKISVNGHLHHQKTVTYTFDHLSVIRNEADVVLNL
jgi:hypothetical protein